MNSEQIKLVIWDLDDTFWHGTLAEDDHVIITQKNINIVKELMNRGIVNSICSKNDFDKAKAVLCEAQIWDWFVFPHIEFTPKGEAVKQIIANMQLRAPNVLFVDDNHANLEEVSFYNPGIQTLPAQELDDLCGLPGTAGKPDPQHKRLEQYKLLQERFNACQYSNDNEEFLRKSDIHICVLPTMPEDAERVHDMIMRTNQLNFTKKRISFDEVKELLHNPAFESATIRVSDRFGDHGVVGWYCLKGGKLEHFLFSCRIINLGIEQYVYAMLGYPHLEISGETASLVAPNNPVPDYITLDNKNKAQPALVKTRSEVTALDKLQIYALGACDLYYMVGHMALPFTNVYFECNTFNGDTRGVNVATEYIRSCFEMGELEKAYCRTHFHNYTGRTAFDTKIFEKEYDYVCMSFHDDFALDIYQSKEFSQMRVVLSNSKSGSFTPILNIEDTKKQEWLSNNFISLGLISSERFRENLEWIAERLPDKTHLVLMTGPEYDYFRDSEPHNAEFRMQVMSLNKVIRNFCDCNPRASLVEMNDVIYERGHFTNFIMHLKPERSYMLAMKMLEVMARTPSTKNVKKGLPIGLRHLILWSDEISLLPNYLALCAMGVKPDAIIAVPSFEVSKPELATLEPHMLYGQSGKYFVLLTPGGNLEYRRVALDFYGYEVNTDYYELEQMPFALEWRE